MCALFARRTGIPVGLLRFLAIFATLGGFWLAFTATIFPSAIGADAEGAGGLASTLTWLGLVFTFWYPFLALFLPEDTPRGTPRRWDLGASVGAVLLLLVVGQAVGFLIAPYWDFAHAQMVAKGPSGLLLWFVDYATEVGFGAQDFVLVAFFVSTVSFVVLQRRGVIGFFRSMYTGVSLVSLALVATAIGVLVPQIDGFEDPDQRVDMEREHADYLEFKRFGYQKLPVAMEDGHEQYQAFRWAEGYFLYHLFHLYGIGMPEPGDLTPTQVAGFESFGRKYGKEEADNRRKQMASTFSARDKINEIGVLIHENEDAFWNFFALSTRLDLNRTYKSSWFATLLSLLGCSIFLSAYKNWRFRASRLPQAFLGGLVAVVFTVLLKVTTALTIPWPDVLAMCGGFLAVALVLGPGVPGSVVSLQKLGFFVVHNGLLVLLLGGGISKLLTDRGILTLDLRDPTPKDTYYRFYRADKLGRMPFAVRLDEFARREWLALEITFPDERFSSRPPRHTLWPGRKIDLDYVDDGEGGTRPDLRIEVESIHDKVDVGLAHVVEAEEPSPHPQPVLEVLVEVDGGEEREIMLPLSGYVTSVRGEILTDKEGQWRLATAYGEAPEEFFPNVSTEVGTLEFTVVGEEDGQARVERIGVGDSVTIQGGYRLEVVSATKDFRANVDTKSENKQTMPYEEQPLGLTAVWLDVYPPDGREPERRVVFEAFDDVAYGLQSQHVYSDVILRYRMDRWSCAGPPRYLFCFGDEGEPYLLSETGERSDVARGEPLALPGGQRVVLGKEVHDARFESNLTFLEPTRRDDGWDADFYAHDPRGVVLRVTRHPGEPDESVEMVELATARAGYFWGAPDGDFRLELVENTEMLPFEWRSVLTIVEKDNAGRAFEVPLGTERAREIRVNDYFYYKGYRFFQTDANAQRPTYSGIGVVYDPGIPFVLWGMYAIIAGASIAFLVRPALKGSKTKVA